MSSHKTSSRADLLTPREASELTNLGTPRTFQRWAKIGKLPHLALPNGRVMFYRRDIEALLQPRAVQDEEGELPRPFEDVPLSGFVVAV